MPSRNRDQYEPLPTSDSPSPRPSRDFLTDAEYEEAESAARNHQHRLSNRAAYANPTQYDKFNPPAPAPWKRAALVFFMLALFIIAWKMRAGVIEPEIVHADR